MSKVRNDLYSIEDIVIDDLEEIEVDNNLQIIGDAYYQILRLKDTRYATGLVLDLLDIDAIKDWLIERRDR